jgi:hypothetical protein
MVDEFARLRRERVGENELGEAKAYMAGNFPLTIETPDEIATQVLNVLFYDLPIDDLQTFRQRVNAVSVDDVEWVANRYIESDRLTVVLVGNASAFLDQLKRVGFNKVEVLSLANLDLSEPDLKRKTVSTSAHRPVDLRGMAAMFRPRALAPSRNVLASAGVAARLQAPPPRGQETLGLTVAPAPPASAAALVDRAIAAMGGLDKLKAVRTVRAVTQSTFNSPQGPVTTETTTYLEYPNRLRVEARLPIGQVVQVYAGGDDAWVKDPNKGIVVPPPAARKDFRDSVQRDALSLLLRAQAGQLKMQLKAPDASPDVSRTVYGLNLSGPELDPVTLFIDTATGMVVRESYSLPAGAGTAEESFTDYRDVDGVKIAFRVSLRRGGLLVLTRVATDVKVNVPVDPSLFARPEKD